MADPVSYLQLLEHGKQIDYLLELPDLDEDEKAELESIWLGLKSREESKFDAIVGVIKECDRCIDQLERESQEIKNNQEHWKRKRDNVINIIKMAYEKQLISSKPTGNKYQATIKATKSKLIDNFKQWSYKERKQFGLCKKTIITRNTDESVVESSEEQLPNREQVRKVLEVNPEIAPSNSRLVKRVSLIYGLRKRVRKGV